MSTTRAQLAAILSPFLRRTRLAKYDLLDLAPQIVCADGFRLSVQASKTHYCLPRDNEGPWEQVEVGYPSQRVEEFMPYIDGDEHRPTDTVYGYVPVGLVIATIDAHGGIDESKMAKGRTR